MNTESFDLKDAKNKQNYLLYEKAGAKNREIVHELIMSYDWNNSILSLMVKYYDTPDLRKAVREFFMERELVLNAMVEKIL